MSYLKAYVIKDAATCISGLQLTNDNYDIALNLLKERYGDHQIIVSAHMNKLLNLQPVYQISNVKDLCNLFDEVETQVRCLSTPGLVREFLKFYSSVLNYRESNREGKGVEQKNF